METLSDYTEKRLRQLNRESALRFASAHLGGSKPRRFISGTAIGGTDGKQFVLPGVNFTLPVPLIWTHAWEYPIGLVRSLEVDGNALFFKGEIVNDGQMPWAEDFWRAIVERRAGAVSIYARKEERVANRYCDWFLDELSVCEEGKDPDALIHRCWEVGPVSMKVGVSSVIEHWRRDSGQ